MGVSWRLARQLAREHGKRVRLWLDDLTVLAKLRPEIDPARDRQHARRRRGARASREPFDATRSPTSWSRPSAAIRREAYVQAMARRAPKPRWINLEYLSAEDWVEGSHALPSPNPRLPLTKHFFFPGFTRAAPAGCCARRACSRRRDEFQADAGAQAAFWRSLVGDAPPEGALKVSLFTYAGAPVECLARACVRHPGPVWLVAPEGVRRATRRSRRDARPAQRAVRRRADVEIFAIPFLAQDRYDQLLWACDVNFVRGEDSFVRAQWAARPFVWHIYPHGRRRALGEARGLPRALHRGAGPRAGGGASPPSGRRGTGAATSREAREPRPGSRRRGPISSAGARRWRRMRGRGRARLAVTAGSCRSTCRFRRQRAKIIGFSA